MDPLPLFSLAQMAVTRVALRTLTERWTSVWMSGCDLPFGVNCSRFVAIVREVLHFIESSGTIPVSIADSIIPPRILKQIISSLSRPEDWCAHASDVSPRAAVWFSDPSRFSCLLRISSYPVCETPPHPLHPFLFWFPPGDPHQSYLQRRQ